MSCYPNNSCNRNVQKSCSNTDVVVYTGENLTCTGIEYGDSLTVVLQKLDEKYCEILDIIENCSNSTTTTTTTSVGGCGSAFVEILNNNTVSYTTTTTTSTTECQPSCGSNPIENILSGI